MALWNGRRRDDVRGTGGASVAEAPRLRTTLERNGATAPLANLSPRAEVRDWLFPGSDELYRSIYTAVSLDTPDVIAVTSAIAGEGKTTTALGLAVTAAQDAPNRKVLLVEADFDQPVLADDFHVESSPGLADCLLSDQPVQSAYRTTFFHNLHLVPAGDIAGGHGRLIRSPLMPHVLETMKRSYDLIILDGPAVLVNSDAVRLSDLADGTVFVVRCGVTPAKLVRQSLDRIDEGKLRGVVLNGQTSAIPPWLRRVIGL